MGLEQEPFRAYHGEKQADTFTIRLNPEERKVFDELKYILQQEKDSTCMKQLSLEVAASVLHDKQTKAVLQVVLNNYRKNKRLGIVTFD